MAKFLGQHFLTDKNKLKEFVGALELKNGDVVIEIGPGHGEITLELRIKNAKLRIIAIEKDEKLFERLKEKFSGDKNVEIIQGDALKILSKITQNSLLITHNYKLAGNIPFYVTGHLLRIISKLKIKPKMAVFIIQKEVAERIAAKPPKMNLLAASVQFWAEPKIAGHISKNHFKPQPKVDAAVIKLRIKNYELRIMKNYYRFINILFKQPRKTIVNNLVSSIKYLVSSMNKEEIVKKLQKADINQNDRPQNLSIEQIIKLSTLF